MKHSDHFTCMHLVFDYLCYNSNYTAGSCKFNQDIDFRTKYNLITDIVVNAVENPHKIEFRFQPKQNQHRREVVLVVYRKKIEL
eukprot:UN22012